MSKAKLHSVINWPSSKSWLETLELGGNCRLLTSDFHNVSQDLYLNVMQHYRMISAKAKYASEWRQREDGG